jgi:osmotically-inducible protein OsmY
MKNNWKRIVELMLLGALFSVMPIQAFGKPATRSNPAVTGNYLERQVRKALVTQPFYTVFDNLEFKVVGHRVELYGQVTQPGVLKSDAENAVKHIEGVEGVTNNIQVLPLSPIDNQIRRAEYRALFGGDGGALYGYSMGANPSIHIIVDNGHVTLEGVVNSTMDKTMATVLANHVPGVFSVANNLRVES